jgi:ABC-type Fe3+/spermidine/putrescine transport system ATPase subunit
MNLFEANVVGVESGRVALDVAGLGRIAVPHRGPAQGSIGIAVRPEKIWLDHEEPPAERIRLRGRVTQLLYYGDESEVFIETETGRTMNQTWYNDNRTIQAPVSLGDQVWLSWDPADTLVLTE